MKELPRTKNALVLRTDFADDAGWKSISSAIRLPVGDFRALVDCVSDPEFDGFTAEQLTAMSQDDASRTFVFVVDQTALTHPDHPILVVDFFDQPGRTFRVIPAEVWSVENNLSISNMEFHEFADNVDDDGIFRGFTKPA